LVEKSKTGVARRARVDEVQLVVRHAGAICAAASIARDEFHVDGPAGLRNRDRLHDLSRLQRPHANAAAGIERARYSMQGRRADEVARHHQVQLRPHGNPVRVESIIGRHRRVLRDQAEVLVVFDHAAGMIARPPARPSS